MRRTWFAILIGLVVFMQLGAAWMICREYREERHRIVKERETVAADTKRVEMEYRSYLAETTSEESRQSEVLAEIQTLQARESELTPRFENSEKAIRETHQTQQRERDRWAMATHDMQRRVTIAQFNATHAVDTSNLARGEIETAKQNIAENTTGIATATLELAKQERSAATSTNQLAQLRADLDQLRKRLPEVEGAHAKAKKRAEELAVHRRNSDILWEILSARKGSSFGGVRLNGFPFRKSNTAEVKRLTDIGVSAEIADKISSWSSVNYGKPPDPPKFDVFAPFDSRGFQEFIK